LDPDGLEQRQQVTTINKIVPTAMTITRNLFACTKVPKLKGSFSFLLRFFCKFFFSAFFFLSFSVVLLEPAVFFSVVA
jgi:hypothetical protein